MKKITVTFDESGSIEIETTGFKGKACEKATESIEKAMGVKSSSKKKPEYYQEQENRITN